MELARNKNDLDEQQRIVTKMESLFPHSPWLAEALFSSGNMYMLRHDYPTRLTTTATWPRTSLRTPTPPPRTGGRLVQLPPGTLSRSGAPLDEQLKLYPTPSKPPRLSTARTPLRDAGSEACSRRGQLPHAHPRLSALLLCTDGAPAAGRSGQHASRATRDAGRPRSLSSRPNPTPRRKLPTDSRISPRRTCWPTPA